MIETTIGTGTYVGIAFQALLSLAFPLILFIYFRKHERISWASVGVGVLVFILFSQVLEKGLHVFMFLGNQTTASALENPWMYAVYGALAAGIFEEVGRYLGFRFLLRNRQERRDGLGLGIGHGGIEAILVGVIVSVQTFVFAIMYNAGRWEELTAGLPPVAAEQLKNQLLSTPLSMYLAGGIERVFAVLLHIALSLVVLYAVRTGKLQYLLYAILLHALPDFLAALYQKQVITSIWSIEAVLLVMALAAWMFIRSSKSWFKPLDLSPKHTD
jgi:uncharacterized membrane protein YhfC